MDLFHALTKEMSHWRNENQRHKKSAQGDATVNCRSGEGRALKADRLERGGRGVARSAGILVSSGSCFKRLQPNGEVRPPPHDLRIDDNRSAMYH